MDRRVGIHQLKNGTRGKPIAHIANYTIHSTVLDGVAKWWCSEDVEEKTGVPLMLVNGADGNIAPIYTVCILVLDPDI